MTKFVILLPSAHIHLNDIDEGKGVIWANTAKGRYDQLELLIQLTLTGLKNRYETIIITHFCV